jgi:hypothetical protein
MRSHLGFADHVRKTNADGGQDARILVHKDGAHAQRPRDGARVLPSGAAKARQYVRRHVVALRKVGGLMHPRNKAWVLAVEA